MASPSLNLEEYQFGDSGVLLNGTSALPFVDVTSVEGLDNAPVRTQTHDMEGQDGGYHDSKFETLRTVTLEGTIYADPTGLESYLDSLKANFAPSSTSSPLYFKTDFEQRLVFGKAQGLRYTKDAKRRLGIVDFQVQFVCEDPRIYTDNLISNNAARSVGTVSVTIDGNRPSPAVITVTGPLTDPTITYTRTGAILDFTGYTLASGESLIIDLNNHTVVQGGVSKRQFMTLNGTWFMLMPGTNTFNLGGTGSTANIKVETRSAWR